MTDYDWNIMRATIVGGNRKILHSITQSEKKVIKKLV